MTLNSISIMKVLSFTLHEAKVFFRPEFGNYRDAYYTVI